MVGSVLMDRLREEGELERIDARYFSTSAAGALGPDAQPLASAFDLDALAAMPVLVSCQGGGYTRKVYGPLRASGWQGIWIDAASALRMEPDTTLVLDPINRGGIDDALHAGVRTFAGSNCTVSLLLMAIAGLLRDWKELGVEWVQSSTYQAASGAGAAQVQELVAQWRILVGAVAPVLDDPTQGVLELDRALSGALRSAELPTRALGYPLAASLLPWVGDAKGDGRTEEEWKGHAEANKLLGLHGELPFDGMCVRVGAIRCHSQSVTVKFKAALPLDEVEARLAASTPWTHVWANDAESTRRALTPASVSGTLDIAVGRVHRLRMGPEYLSLFTVGDQLLWGAAEPLRRMLNILEAHGSRVGAGG